MSVRSRMLELAKGLDGALGPTLARASCGARRRLPASPDDVLIVRLWGLGNLALLLPVLAANRARRLRLMTLERNAAFLRVHAPWVELLTVPDPFALTFLPAVVSVARELRRDPPDVVLDAETFLRLPAVLTRRATGRPLVGLATPGQAREPLLDRPVAYDPLRHIGETFAALAAAAGLAAPTGPGALRAHPAARRRVLTRLGPVRGPLVVLHPGSGDHFPGRRWAPERFGSLARLLVEGPGACVVLTGSAAEAGLITRRVRPPAGTLDLCGRLDVAELVALLAEADLLVSNDTGPVHLADALGTPTVALYGPNTPHRYGPRRAGSVALFADLPCSPCLDDRLAKRSACRDHRCMAALHTDVVLSACLCILQPRLRFPGPSPVLDDALPR